MSKIVYFLLIVTLATLITARPADDKKPDDAAKDAAKAAKDAGDKAKAGADDAAKKPEDALKDKAKDAGADKKTGGIKKVMGDWEETGKDVIKSAADTMGMMFGGFI